MPSSRAVLEISWWSVSGREVSPTRRIPPHFCVYPQGLSTQSCLLPREPGNARELKSHPPLSGRNPKQPWEPHSCLRHLLAVHLPVWIQLQELGFFLGGGDFCFFFLFSSSKKCLLAHCHHAFYWGSKRGLIQDRKEQLPE